MLQSIKFKLVDTNVVNFKTCTVTQQGLTNFLKFYLVIKVLYNLFYKELISIRGLTETTVNGISYTKAVVNLTRIYHGTYFY